MHSAQIPLLVAAFRGTTPVTGTLGAQVLHYKQTDEIEMRTALTICGKIRAQSNHRIFKATAVQKETLPVCAVCERKFNK